MLSSVTYNHLSPLSICPHLIFHHHTNYGCADENTITSGCLTTRSVTMVECSVQCKVSQEHVLMHTAVAQLLSGNTAPFNLWAISGLFGLHCNVVLQAQDPVSGCNGLIVGQAEMSWRSHQCRPHSVTAPGSGSVVLRKQNNRRKPGTQLNHASLWERGQSTGT